jgi:hypothetical protein
MFGLHSISHVETTVPEPFELSETCSMASLPLPFQNAGDLDVDLLKGSLLA